jgi:hypothetical protein
MSQNVGQLMLKQIYHCPLMHNNHIQDKKNHQSFPRPHQGINTNEVTLILITSWMASTTVFKPTTIISKGSRKNHYNLITFMPCVSTIYESIESGCGGMSLIPTLGKWERQEDYNFEASLLTY